MLSLQGKGIEHTLQFFFYFYIYLIQVEMVFSNLHLKAGGKTKDKYGFTRHSIFKNLFEM